MSITRETLRLQRGLRAQLDERLDGQSRDLIQAWAEAWEEVAIDLNDAVLSLASQSRNGRVSGRKALQSRRLQNSLAFITSELQRLFGAAGERVIQDLTETAERAGVAQQVIIASQLPPDAPTPKGLGNTTIAAIVQRSTDRIVSLFKPLTGEAYEGMRRELIRGVAVGDNPRTAARRMVRRVEGRFNGGLSRALVISRTEMLDAHRAAEQASEEEDEELLTGWEWSATLDARTCPACWAQNGELYEIAEPGPLGHQQCRCARLPRTKTWRELGFDIDEPPPINRLSAQEKFLSLTPAQQQHILGAKRYAAWLRGEYPMEKWAVRRGNPNWRDAFYVSKVE